VVLPLAFLLFLSGGSLFYWRSTSVRLTADGQTRRIFTQAHRLDEFLKEQNLSLGPSDFITPPLDTPIGHNTAAKITRVTTEIEIQTSTGTPIVTWQTQNRTNLRRILAQRGHVAVTRDKVQITKHDGLEISRAILAEKRMRQPFFTLTLLNKEGRPV